MPRKVERIAGFILRNNCLRRSPCKKSCDPLQLISEEAADEGIVSKTRIYIALDSSARTAKPLKDLATGRFCKEDIISTAHQ
jgi:hypothetical protein